MAPCQWGLHWKWQLGQDKQPPRDISHPCQHQKQMRGVNPALWQTEGLAASTGMGSSQESWGTFPPCCGPQSDPVSLVSAS